MSRLRTSRRVAMILVAAIAALILTATMVVASHQFTDVPNTEPLHGAVDFMKDHNITAGCGGTKYCPNNAVTRGQMAIFMQKLHAIEPHLAITSSSAATNYDTTTYTQVTGATVNITVPASNTATIVATFTAESSCEEPLDASDCLVRILVDGVEATPAVGDDFAFDSGPSGVEWESHSVTRYKTGVGPGTHTVSVQAATFLGGGGAGLRLDDWVLQAVYYIT